MGVLLFTTTVVAWFFVEGIFGYIFDNNQDFGVATFWYGLDMLVCGLLCCVGHSDDGNSCLEFPLIILALASALAGVAISPSRWIAAANVPPSTAARPTAHIPAHRPTPLSLPSVTAPRSCPCTG